MAVGMNIDIASIDMVSEVNMVSMEVHVSVNLPLGRRRGKEVYLRRKGSVHVCKGRAKTWNFALETHA